MELALGRILPESMRGRAEGENERPCERTGSAEDDETLRDPCEGDDGDGCGSLDGVPSAPTASE